MSWRADLAVLQHREVRLFLGARFVSLLGSAVGPIALSFAALDLSDSARTLGLVLASQSVPMVTLMLLGGAIADRLPRLLVVAHLVCAGTQATILGGAIAGAIVGFIGPAPGLAVDAAAFLLAASLLYRLPLTRLARTSKSLLAAHSRRRRVLHAHRVGLFVVRRAVY